VTRAFVTFFLRDHHIDGYIHAFPSSISARLLTATDSLSDPTESLYSAPQEVLLCSDYLNAPVCVFQMSLYCSRMPHSCALVRHISPCTTASHPQRSVASGLTLGLTPSLILYRRVGISLSALCSLVPRSYLGHSSCLYRLRQETSGIACTTSSQPTPVNQFCRNALPSRHVQ
jgi:hypothetical protein